MKQRLLCLIFLATIAALPMTAPEPTSAKQDWTVGIWRNYTSADGLASDSVYAIAIDENGHKWFGTGNGVSEFDGLTWTNYTPADGLASNYVQSIAIDRNGNKWFGTSSYGLSKFDGTNWTTYNTSNSGLPDNDVRTLGVDRAGNLWAGTYYGGAVKFDGATWTSFTPSNSGLRGHRLEDIAFDSAGHVWFSSLEPASAHPTGLVAPMWAYAQGVQEFNGANWTSYDTSNSGLVADWVWDIAIDSLGHKWFAAWGGVTVFDGKSWTTYDTSNSDLPESYVYAMATDPDGSKWFVYGWGNAGVTRFNGTRWTTYNTANSGLADNWVTSVAIEREHKWFGTQSNGVSEYIPNGASGNVTKNDGGIIQSADGSTTLAFAPGATDAGLEVMLIPDTVAQYAPLTETGHPFELRATLAGSGGPPVETIAGTYTITVQYTQSDMGASLEL